MYFYFYVFLGSFLIMLIFVYSFFDFRWAKAILFQKVIII